MMWSACSRPQGFQRANDACDVGGICVRTAAAVLCLRPDQDGAHAHSLRAFYVGYWVVADVYGVSRIDPELG
jgi:hypothetical protein